MGRIWLRKATDKLEDRAAFQTSVEKDLEVLVDSLNVSQLCAVTAKKLNYIADCVSK